MSAGSSEDLLWLRKALEERYAITTEALGDSKGETQDIRVLNRIIPWEKGGISYEPDPRHAEIVAKEMGVDNAKGLTTQSIKEELKEEDATTGEPISIELQGAAATKFGHISET